MGEKQTLIKNGLLFSLAPFIPKAVSILMLPVMTNYLTATDYGIAATISAYSESIGAFATLGLSVILLNSFFKNPNNYQEIWRKIYGFLKCWMVVYACLQAVILYFCIPEEALDNRWWIILLTNFSNVFFGPTATIGNAYYIYTKQSVPIVWRSVFSALISLVFTFVLVVYYGAGYMGWYIGGFIGTFFSNATYWPVVIFKLKLKPDYHFKLSEIKEYLKISMPTVPHYYTQYLLESSGKVVLDRNGEDQANIGKLSIAQNFGGMLQTITQGINNAMSPYCMTYIKEKRDNRYRSISILYISMVFGLAFVVSLWSKELFSILLSNEALANSYPYGILYIMALCYRPLYCLAANYYLFYEKTKQLLLISFASGCIAIVLYIVLTPIWGVWGFLVGHYIACLYYGYSGYLYSCYINNSGNNVPYKFFFITQLILTAIAYLCVEVLFVKVVISSILLAIAIFLLLSKKYKQFL